MRKFILFLAIVMAAGLPTVWGQSFIVNDVIYITTYGTTNVEVIGYSGTPSNLNLTIPSSVLYNGTTYTVTSINNEAFKNKNFLREVTISATTIGNKAFFGCNNLSRVTINNSVTTIGTEAFSGCSSLSSVTINNSVTSIGMYAFSDCSNLRNLDLGDSVTSIGQFAFGHCVRLTSVTIPSSVTSIGFGIFTGCTGLTSISVDAGNTVYDSRNNCNAIIKTSTNTLIQGCQNSTIPNGVTSIDNNAFKDHTGLTSISIPESVTSIGMYAFSGCTGLTIVTIPNSVTSIGQNAFTSCSGLISLTIPNSVTTIGAYVFAGCTSLSSVTIPSSVTSIGQYAFNGCSGLQNITVEAQTVPVTAANAFSGVPTGIPVYVPCGMVSDYKTATGWSQFNNTIQQNPNSPHYSLYYTLDNTNNTATVYGSAANDRVAIDNCGTFANLVIPSSVTSEGNTYTVTSIGERAFYRNSDLVSVEIPESVTSIGEYAFNRCSSLASATIPNTVTTIGEGVFYYCENLASVTIGNGVTSISPNAFEGCGLTSITIPNNVTSIGRGAFRNCSSLRSVNIPEHVTSIGAFVFQGCSGLTSISVAAGNTTYNSNGNCNAIIETSSNKLMSGCKNTVIPDSVTVIGDNAFNGCTGLSSITIPNSVTTIEAQAFHECSGLESVIIGNSVDFIGESAFKGCSSLNSVTFGNSVDSIGGSAFKGCSSLNSVTFDNSPTAIGPEAFNGCSSLSSLSLGNSVTTIEDNAFQGCSSLETLTIPSSVNSILGSPFKDCISLAEIIVEAGNNTYDSRNGCNAIIHSSTNTLVQGCNNTVIPNSVTVIAEAAFYGCSGLTSVTIPNSATSINPYTFYGCSGLESVTIPESVTDIYQYAFSGCSGLESVTIPDSVTAIRQGAFSGCSGLKSVVILTNGITSNFLVYERNPGYALTSNDAFSGCNNLKTVYKCNDQSQAPTRDGSYSFFGCTAKRIVNLQRSGSGLNTLYVIVNFRLVDQPESNCQSNQIPKADLPDNFICLAEGGSGWKARNIVLTDCEDEFEAGADITADHAIYKRDFANGNRSTLYLPFTAAKPDGFEVYEFSEFTDNTLRFTPLADNAPIAAYTPYLVGYQLAKDGSTTCTIEQTNAMFPRTVDANRHIIEDNGMSFQGVVARTEMTSTNNYGYKDGYFVQSGGSAHVNPFRCYFTLSDSQNASPILNVDTDGDYLSIDEVEGNVEQPAIRYSNDVYDLMGRLVRKNADSLRGLPRGIYIWKGQKVLNYR